MMSTGELSDLVYYVDRTDINKYGQEGAFAPLNDLIDEYAPNYKKYLDAHPEVRKAITTEDGQIYGLLVAGSDEVKAAQGWEIRKDWLDKLGLETPKTVNELHDVLKKRYFLGAATQETSFSVRTPEAVRMTGSSQRVSLTI